MFVIVVLQIFLLLAWVNKSVFFLQIQKFKVNFYLLNTTIKVVSDRFYKVNSSYLDKS